MGDQSEAVDSMRNGAIKGSEHEYADQLDKMEIDVNLYGKKPTQPDFKRKSQAPQAQGRLSKAETSVKRPSQQVPVKSLKTFEEQ